jgi:hypothetical protein
MRLILYSNYVNYVWMCFICIIIDTFCKLIFKQNKKFWILGIEKIINIWNKMFLKIAFIRWMNWYSLSELNWFIWEYINRKSHFIWCWIFHICFNTNCWRTKIRIITL